MRVRELRGGMDDTWREKARFPEVNELLQLPPRVPPSPSSRRRRQRQQQRRSILCRTTNCCCCCCWIMIITIEEVEERFVNDQEVPLSCFHSDFILPLFSFLFLFDVAVMIMVFLMMMMMMNIFCAENPARSGVRSPG